MHIGMMYVVLVGQLSDVCVLVGCRRARATAGVNVQDDSDIWYKGPRLLILSNHGCFSSAPRCGNMHVVGALTSMF